MGTYGASEVTDVFVGNPEFRNVNLVSAIELVDTSTPLTLSAHPIFSIFNFTRKDQNKYSYTSYLINNQIIKYHRSTDTTVFPRLRVKIDNSDYTNKSRNFLEPNHDYEITIKAHNLATQGTGIGGSKLGVWVRTEPENNKVWCFNPLQVADECGQFYDNWFQINLSDLSSINGINKVQQSSQIQPFNTGSLANVIGSGEGAGLGLLNITEETFDYRCWEAPIITKTIVGSSPQAIANINEKTKQTFIFKFSTKNNKTIKPLATYLQQYGKVHRTDQKYVLEFFVPRGDDNKFVVFEDISIKDITNYNNAIIKSKYGEVQIDSNDLKSVFRFFKTISTGLASRNHTITSGTMEVSGGSRMNYRSNKKMYTNIAGSFTGVANDFGGFVSGIEINEG